MYLGRHTCLARLADGPGLESVPLLAELGGAPPYVIAVGDRRRVTRVLARLEDALNLSAHCGEEIGERAAGRVELGIGRAGAAAVMVVETQMGGPATEIVLREVLDESFHPAKPRVVIRVGTCAVRAGEGQAPDLVVAEFAAGWSAAVEQAKHGVLSEPSRGRPPVLPCSTPVIAALCAAATAACGGVYSKDSLYGEQDESFARIMQEAGCIATEMELATIGPLAESLGVAWGGIMATAGLLDDWYDAERIAHNEELAMDAAIEAIRILAGE